MKISLLKYIRPFLCVSLLCLCACKDIPHDDQTVLKHDNSVYHGGIKQGCYDGYGVLSVGDSVVYAGEWRSGKREGRGVCHDKLGRRIVGKWHADTLVSGTRYDAKGTYRGTFDRNGIANGHGSYYTSGHEFYQGEWADDKRSGFGFAIASGTKLRVGEWKKNRYLGERIEYRADRIYGIDVSRFQHDVGRKRYAIAWNNVRITHLGTLSRKTITGKVDYPVAFCYIKSTEGLTVKNRYYRSDYLAARAAGIKCGAYHFFSTKTSGAKQGHFFVQNSLFRKGDLPPVLDIEPTDAQIRAMGGANAMFRAVREWIRVVRNATGVRPVLYISQSFVNRYLSLAPDLKRNYIVWIARYGEYKPDVHLAFWQLCPDGTVRGITPKVDINVFNGYKDEYEEFLRKECIKVSVAEKKPAPVKKKAVKAKQKKPTSAKQRAAKSKAKSRR